MAKNHSIVAAAVVAVISLSTPAFASTVGAAHGHHGGGNNGAVGASSGAFGGGSAAGSAGQSGMGGSYWAPNPDASPVDAYQPWPQSQMKQFQKP
jgi:hypothetical protein